MLRREFGRDVEQPIAGGNVSRDTDADNDDEKAERVHVEAVARQEVNSAERTDPPGEKEQLGAPCGDTPRACAPVRLPVEVQRDAEIDAKERYQQRAVEVVATVVAPGIQARRGEHGRQDQ